MGVVVLTDADRIERVARKVYPLIYWNESQVDRLLDFFEEHFGPPLYRSSTLVCREFAKSIGADKRPFRDWKCRGRGALKKWILNEKPFHLYFGPVFATLARPVYVFREPVFEADASKPEPRAAAEAILPVLDALPGLGVQEVLVCYSGGRSFHVHVLKPRAFGLLSADARKRLAKMLPSMDENVAGDVARLIRVPLSIHGDYMRVVEPVCRGSPDGCADLLRSIM